jgi:hypothetical protein
MFQCSIQVFYRFLQFIYMQTKQESRVFPPCVKEEFRPIQCRAG